MQTFFVVRYYLDGERMQEFCFPIDKKMRYIGYSEQCQVQIREREEIAEQHVQFYCHAAGQYQLKMLSPRGATIDGNRLEHRQTTIVKNDVPVHFSEHVKLVFAESKKTEVVETTTPRIGVTRVLKKQVAASDGGLIQVDESMSAQAAQSAPPAAKAAGNLIVAEETRLDAEPEAQGVQSTPIPRKEPVTRLRMGPPAATPGQATQSTTPAPGKQEPGKPEDAKQAFRSQLQSLYAEIETKIQGSQPADSAATDERQKKSNKLAALHTKKYEKESKVLSLYRKIFVALCLLAGVFTCAFAYWLFPRAGAGEKPAAIPPTPEQPPRQTAPMNATQMAALGAVPHLLLDNLRAIYLQTETPSQEFCNELLRRLVAREPEYRDSPYRGDVYNLIGRLYHYKIWLDADDGLFDPEWAKVWPLEANWKTVWLDEATRAWQNAREAYLDKQAKTVFNLPVMAWMPERSAHPQSPFVIYKSPAEAAADVEKWLLRVKKK